MNYYYDVVLDFQENNYYFYDVEKDDCFEYIKKIPIFQISNKTYKDVINYNIVFDKSFLKKIHNKTVTKNGLLEYSCILADRNNCIALEFSEDGTVITRSILSLEDELNILEAIYTIDLINIKYEKKGSLIINKNLKKEEYIKHLINIEINKLYKENNLYKLQFLYLEWFGKKETNIDTIINKMRNKLNKEIGSREEKILRIIKMSYNNV